MAATKRSDEQILRDRIEIAKLRMMGKTQDEIALKLGMTQQMVSYDLKEIRKQWAEELKTNMSEMIAEEKAKIDFNEQQALLGWEKSLGEHKRKRSKQSQGGHQTQSAEVETILYSGEVRFLQQALACSKERRELLGLDAPKRTEISGPNGGPIETSSIRERFISRIVSAAARLGAKQTAQRANG